MLISLLSIMYMVGFRVQVGRPQIINLNFVTTTEIFQVTNSLIMMILLRHSMSIVDIPFMVAVVVAEIREP